MTDLALSQTDRQSQAQPRAPLDPDHAALAAACEEGVGLATIVGIEGSFSRRLGAQLAVRHDGSVVGGLADGCLERQLATDLLALTEPCLKRYGRGSPQIDFRLPCGGALDIWLDPTPDRMACRAEIAKLISRQPASLSLSSESPLPSRRYLPALALRILGEGPEPLALQRLALAAGYAVETVTTKQLSIGQPSYLPAADEWTAVVLLFHDHEWESALLLEALASPAFYIGAQGGEGARVARASQLLANGVREEDLARLRSPIGAVAACRTPETLALSILAEVAGAYEHLHAPA
ncbi:MAG: XdhC family protein [Sphingomonadaceae bacterium]